VSVQPDFAHTQQAEDNRVTKARNIARWCWERGLAGADILGASDAQRRRWAREAGALPPRTMETWDAVVSNLRLKAEWVREHPDDPGNARPLQHERAMWLGEAPVDPTDDGPSVEPAPHVPTGWAELAALGPVEFAGARCSECGAPAVVAVPTADAGDQWRCAHHPPQPGEWGAHLDWTPRMTKPCPSGVCYCGRCKHRRSRPAPRKGTLS